MTRARIVARCAAGGLAAGLLLAGAGGASAQNSSSGSGLTPFATESGNDRSAGVNNGNYRPPRYYGPGAAAAPRGYGRPVYGDERRRSAPYYGYPY
ncbi:hypothetical protein ASG60_10990 [Methylobacterium sp. Leaf469]|jgi:hypothetical protein|uniref:hypothetical protein n=1 Tax=Methylobacterium sp. Leaf469 TaxID=1736387 RepID=UPI0006FF0792|nr:hypothetical protein [Methylobacterium sp. Leaf469]KQT90145.1 hypothetical protein ASG60_10990 [Methylobacterium sp. Leaf469]